MSASSEITTQRENFVGNAPDDDDVNEGFMYTIHKSANCAKSTDVGSMWITGHATLKSDPSRMVGPFQAISCQTRNMSKPDEITHAGLLNKSKAAMVEAFHCDPDEPCELDLHLNSLLLGAQTTQFSADKMKATGMSSSCYNSGQDFKDATHKGEARCYPQREMTDTNGNPVLRTNMSVTAALHVCDLTDEAMQGNEYDLKIVAEDNLLDKGFKLNSIDDLACDFSYRPFI